MRCTVRAPVLPRFGPLPRACERVAGALDEAAALGEKVGPWFQQWTAQRWIADVQVDPEVSGTPER